VKSQQKQSRKLKHSACTEFHSKDGEKLDNLQLSTPISLRRPFFIDVHKESAGLEKPLFPFGGKITGSKFLMLLCLNIYSIRGITTKGFAKIININENIATSGMNGKISMIKSDAWLG
jgi:hypothetical protein